MKFITNQDRAMIRDAIREAEAQTTAELVVVIAKQSDPYLYIPTLWAALIALSSPIAMELLFIGSHYPYGLLLQLTLFFALFLLFQWPTVKMRLIPKSVTQRRASRMAFEQFYKQGVHLTKERSGVLIFVSVAERFVEIVADQGIHQLTSKERWQQIVETMIQSLKQGEICQGFEYCIKDCGVLMKEYYPVEGGPQNEKNERPDHLIEIDLP